jgi:pyruvate/2-oxoglutarate dehydrogenase complex dihydrolipoamide acyltransferase (E2) component
MKKNWPDHEVVPFPKVRLRITDSLGLQRRKHIIHALTEVDVTEARRQIRELNSRTGETLSLTAFATHAVATAVDENKYMHAYREGRRRLIVFNDVDVATLVEHEVDGERIATPHVVRAANRKTLSEINREFRAARQQKARDFRTFPLHEKLFFSLPAPVRVIFLHVLARCPRLRKRVQGTVAITAVGMFGQGIGWVIPMSRYSLCVTLGGISEKPGVVERSTGKQVEAREFLSVTISVDHEIIDGAPLARFASRLKELLEDGCGLNGQTDAG